MQQRLNDLLERYLNRTATEAELAELFDLIREKKYSGEIESALQKQWIQQSDSEKVRFALRDESQVLQQIVGQPHSITEYKTRVPFIRRIWVRYAAAVIVVFATGFYLLNKNNRNTDTIVVETIQSAGEQDVLPGSNKAVLTLADGSQVILDDADNGMLAMQGNSNVIKKEGELIYGAPQTKNNSGITTATYNTMTTPRGGQYKLRLPDGSRVWLNAASSITYPVVFNDKERVVAITGEAYFEVSKDASRKFLVNANGIQTEVLGTEFNINSYSDEEKMNITLVNGAVKVSASAQKSAAKEAKVLKPGQQAELNKTTGTFSINTADVDAVIAWKNGFFQFNADDIRTIMREIGRWYDIEVSYAGKIPEGHYSGIVSRSSDLSKVLKILEESDLRFKIETGKLIVL